MACVGIFDRVAGLPVVQSTYDKVSEVYSSAKERSSIVSIALNAVEASVQVVTTSAQPIVQTLEKPIAQVDAFACRQFDYLQESVPAIQSTPEEVVEGTKRYVAGKLRSGADAVANNAVTSLVSSRLDHVLSATDSAVDFILPDESGAAAKADPSVHAASEEPAAATPLARLSTISGKVTDRSRALAVKQVNNAQRRAEDALYQLRSNMVVICEAQAELQVQRERLLRSIDERQASLRTRVASDSKRIVTAVQDQAETVRTTLSSAKTSAMTAVQDQAESVRTTLSSAKTSAMTAVQGQAESVRTTISIAKTSALASLPASVALPAGYTLNIDVLVENMSRYTASTMMSLQTIAALVRHMPQNLHQPIQTALEQSRSLHNMAMEIARGNPMTKSMLDQATSLITSISASTSTVGTYLRRQLSSTSSYATADRAFDDLAMEDEDSGRLADNATDSEGEEEVDEEDGVTEV